MNGFSCLTEPKFIRVAGILSSGTAALYLIWNPPAAISRVSRSAVDYSDGGTITSEIFQWLGYSIGIGLILGGYGVYKVAQWSRDYFRNLRENDSTRLRQSA